MLTLREMMTALYIDGGAYCAEACAWLHEDDDVADALDMIESVLDDFCSGAFDAKSTIENIARIIGYPLTAGDEA